MPNVFRSRQQELEAGRLGMTLFLLSLAVLFASVMLAFLILRIELRDRWPESLPSMPIGMWIATLVLIASSVTMQRALQVVRRDNQRELRWMMRVTFLLGITFLALQSLCWVHLLDAILLLWNEDDQSRFALTSFFVLSGVHAAHVIGGIIPMAIVTYRAWRQRYHAEHHEGVTYCAMYWHFLDAVWVLLFISLLIAL